jgi:hypothetical protein
MGERKEETSQRSRRAIPGFFFLPGTHGLRTSGLKSNLNAASDAGLKACSTRLFLGPICAVEGAVLDGFGDVFGFDLRGFFDVGYGAGYFQDAVVGAGA